MFLGITINNPISWIVSGLVVLILISDILAGYRDGFLESGVKFVKNVIAMIIAYFCRTSLSHYLYINLPFFKLKGIFNGVDAVNILIYELIAFFAVFIIVLVILNTICSLLRIEARILRIVSIIGVPNKIMGAIIGGLKSVVGLYFLLSLFFMGANFMQLETGNSFADYIVKFPVLKNTFGNVIDSFDEITELAIEYKNVQDKEELGNKSIEILLKYNVISQENLDILIESGKISYTK